MAVSKQCESMAGEHGDRGECRPHTFPHLFQRRLQDFSGQAALVPLLPRPQQTPCEVRQIPQARRRRRGQVIIRGKEQPGHCAHASPAALAPPLLGRADGGSGIAGGAGRGWLLGVGLRSAAATMSLSSDEKLARLARQRAACRECKVGHQSVSKRCQLCVLSIEVEG